MQDFRKLKVWQKSHELTLDIYRISERFPKTEIYGLTSQMRRAASSIPANIAEGCGRSSNADLRFLHIALGSTNKLAYQLILARDLNFMVAELYERLSQQTLEVQRRLAHPQDPKGRKHVTGTSTRLFDKELFTIHYSLLPDTPRASPARSAPT